MNYDVFNGDADGIISLIQLRLANPIDAELVTGVKRDIQLLNRVNAVRGDSITVLDISMDKNSEALNRILNDGAQVFYADHHQMGDVPEHSNLSVHVDLDPNTCTALIVDNILGGQFHPWAITAAYGDNLIAKADSLAKRIGLNKQQSEQLKELGTLINYNGYGSQVDDLHFSPADLYLKLVQYDSPFDVISDESSPYKMLQRAYEQDLFEAQSIPAQHQSHVFKLIELPDMPWSRRISGVYGNLLANESPSKAHGVLTHNYDGSYTFSLRAPLDNKQGAADICAQFETGGGRAAAGGVNRLVKSQLKELIAKVEAYYG